MADASQLVGDLDQPHLQEVPDVRGELAGVARARGRLAGDVLVEVLVDAVDEDRDRRRDRAQAGDQLVVGVVRRPEEVAAIEVEQVDEVVDDAREVRVPEERVELRVDAQALGHVQTLERRRRDRDQPDPLPVVGGLAVERHHRGVEDLVADRLVEEPVLRDADRLAVAVGDALGLEEEGLPEPFRRSDDEAVAALELEEALDPRRAVEEGGVQVVGDLDVVGVYGPGPHEVAPSTGSEVGAPGGWAWTLPGGTAGV